MSTRPAHLTIIAKAPLPGRVKTRLCPPCTPAQAAVVAIAALADTCTAVARAARHVGARAVLLLDGEPQPWMPSEFAVVVQRGGGLEQRLANGFHDLGPGIIIGMETPHAAGQLADAARWLDRGCDVLGLATDGGYWAIGLSETSPDVVDAVFDGVPMSSSNSGLAQLRRLHQLGRSVRMLSSARDLDDVDDLRAVAAARRPGLLGPTARHVLDALR